eukprot:2301068-Heterocapsa_arctica.AAC.1
MTTGVRYASSFVDQPYSSSQSGCQRIVGVNTSTALWASVSTSASASRVQQYPWWVPYDL